MKAPLFQVDAFTTRRFAGNPAAVMLLEDYPADELLRAVAAEKPSPAARERGAVARVDGVLLNREKPRQ